MSEEVEIRLTRSLKEERTRNYWLLWALADRIEAAERMTGKEWIADPFTFLVTRQAIIQFFDRLRPTGDVKIPESQTAILGLDRVPAKVKQLLISKLVDPVAWGGMLADTLIVNLQRAADAREQTLELDRYKKPARYLAGLVSDPPVHGASWNQQEAEE
jgi:hypothetical protein